MPEPVAQYESGGSLPPQPSFRSNSIFAGPSSMQTDRRFSYFPPDFTQPQVLPNAWNPVAAGQSQVSAPPPSTSQFQQRQQQQQPVIADASYFMQPAPYVFGTHMFGDEHFDTQMRQGSLSQEQQFELMQSLETDGLNEIDTFMSLSAGYENSIKP